MALSDAKVRNAKPRTKPYKIYDGDGLFLFVHPRGAKYWRLKYSFAGQEKLLSFGMYPDVGLEEARERRGKARKLLKAGTDPGIAQKEGKRQAAADVENRFETLAREWMGQREKDWDEKTARIVRHRLEQHAFPEIGARPINSLTAPELLKMLRRIENKGLQSVGRRVKQDCQNIFSYAIITSRAAQNPARDLGGALKTYTSKNRAYLTEQELPEFFAAFKTSRASEEVRLAFELLILTFVRSGELRKAEWTEFDLDKAEWRIPAKRMKMKDQHIVPLSSQALEVLGQLKRRTGYQRFVFPIPHGPEKPMSENALLKVIERMGFKGRTTVHGFRSTASTILNENGFMPDVIERQLAHTERNRVRAAYNHAQYLPERRKMMQWWADYLDDAAKRKP